MYIRSVGALLALISPLISACMQDTTSSYIPTARIVTITQTALPPTPQLQSIPTSLPTPFPPTATYPQNTPTLLEQYRTWMDEAHAMYPYAESVDTMWSVMLCESSGNPDNATDTYYGLFQYSSETWAGDWNPYRDQPILDPRAQIFATAKAWYEGHQGWWGCY